MVATRTIVEFASVSDAAEIAGLSRRHIEYGLRWRYVPAMIREAIRSKTKNVVVAREGDSLAGFGIMTYGQDSANLDLLAVKRPYRRSGVARQIVQWLEKVAHTAGILHIFVQVRKSNHAAIGFYRKLGFQVVEELSGYYQGRESALVMCKGIRQLIDHAQSFDATNNYGAG